MPTRGEHGDKGNTGSINIINALRRGTVPAGGLERIAVGIGVEEGVIASQLRMWHMAGGT